MAKTNRRSFFIISLFVGFFLLILTNFVGAAESTSVTTQASVSYQNATSQTLSSSTATSVHQLLTESTAKSSSTVKTPVTTSTTATSSTHSGVSSGTPAAISATPKTTQIYGQSASAPTPTEDAKQPQNQNNYRQLAIIVLLVTIAVLAYCFWRWRNTVITIASQGQQVPFLDRSRSMITIILFVLFVGGLSAFQLNLLSKRPYLADTNPPVDWGKYVIWMGWNPPTFDYYAAHPELLTDKMFDGIVLQSNQVQVDGQSFHASTFNPTIKLDSLDFAPVVQQWLALKNQSTSLQHSLLRMNAGTGFNGPGYNGNNDRRQYTLNSSDDDYTQLLANWQKAINFAHDSQLEGIMLDTEGSAQESFFDYPSYYKGQDLASLSPNQFAPVEAEMKTRMEAIGKELATETTRTSSPQPFNIVLTFADSLFIPPLNFNLGWQDQHLELLPSFIDGLIQGSGDNINIIDGYEKAYDNKTLSQFATQRQEIKAAGSQINATTQFPLSSYPDLYNKKMQVSFGLYLDNHRPWYWQRADGQWINTDRSVIPAVERLIDNGDASLLEQNYFSPSAIQDSLRAGLRQTDHYVWIHSERPDVFGYNANASDTNPDRPLNDEYRAALRTVRDDSRAEQPPLASCGAEPPSLILAGHTYDFSSNIDPVKNNDDIALIVSTVLPTGLTRNDATGQIHWQPAASQAGHQTVNWTASNGVRQTVCSVPLIVVASAPKLTLTIESDITNVKINDQVQYTINVANSGNDTAISPIVALTLPTGWSIQKVDGTVLKIDGEQLTLPDLAENANQTLTVEAVVN